MSKFDLSKLTKTEDGMSFDHCVGVDYGADKMAKIEQLNADLQAGRVKLPSVEWQREYMGEWVASSSKQYDAYCTALDRAAEPVEPLAVGDYVRSEGDGWWFTGRITAHEFAALGDSRWWVCLDGCSAPHQVGLTIRAMGSELRRCEQPRSVDPLDVEYDGVKLRTLLLATRGAGQDKMTPLARNMSPAQRAAVSAHWSAELRAKVEASRKADDARKASVVNAWDPEDV
jgi:hypothetical protein